MSEAILAIGITATCADGSVHDDVIMRLVDGQVIYLYEVPTDDILPMTFFLPRTPTRD
jgi:hypothetical protein